MIDAAVVLCPRTDTPEAELLEMRVAGIPMPVRALLTARQGGIRRFLLVASASQQGWLRLQLEGETRLDGRVQLLESAEALVAPVDNLLLLPSVFLDSTALRSWLARVEQSGSLASSKPGVGPTAVPARHLLASLDAALGRESGLARYLMQVQGDGGLCRVPWEGAGWQSIQSPQEVPRIEGRMIAASRSPDDGPIVDRFVNRTLSAHLTRWLLT